MLRTFNCGFGMVVFAAAEREEEARTALARAGLAPSPIGRLIRRDGRASVHARAAEAMSGRVRTARPHFRPRLQHGALIEAARGPDFPAEIALVLSDKPEAAGLESARAAGIAAEALDARGLCRQAGVRGGAAGGARERRHRTHLPRRLHAHSERSFVERWRGRILNIHPSLLPTSRGLHTHERALAEARAEHGCTVHFVTAELDAGPIVAQARVPVLPDDDAERLAARVLVEEHSSIRRRSTRSPAPCARPAPRSREPPWRGPANLSQSRRESWRGPWRRAMR